VSARLKVEIFAAKNGQWAFRVIRGARIILGPVETYALRGGARRAVRALAAISTDASSSSWVSPLQAACLLGLEDEQRAWDARRR